MPDDDIRIRPVDFSRREDIDSYLAMLDAYARDPMGAGTGLPQGTADRLARDLARHPGVHALLAEHETSAIGFATCFLGYSTFQARPLLNIHDIAVVPAWRGRSVARRLLAAIDQLARQLGCCRLTLEVRADNPRARAIYEATGFAAGTCSLFMEKSL